MRTLLLSSLLVLTSCSCGTSQKARKDEDGAYWLKEDMKFLSKPTKKVAWVCSWIEPGGDPTGPEADDDEKTQWTCITMDDFLVISQEINGAAHNDGVHRL